MSYDISIRVKAEGVNAYVEAEDLGNITWNVKRLIKESSGWDIKNCDNNGPIIPWIEKIENGIKELTGRPEVYRQYEALNGWGTVEGTLAFYQHCLKKAKEWVEDYEELLPASVIWVA